ncbi:COP9 signalosome (CSN) subunit [Gaertneriomyces sp. JEL0708]|nr:COP9 signalosome (CSN) subunit [Gaertneriomyces sp. JEL0708]
MQSAKDAFVEYLANIASAIENEDGTTLAGCLKIDDPHTEVLRDVQRFVKHPETLVRNRLDDAWAELVNEHMRVLREYTTYVTLSADGGGNLGIDDTSRLPIVRAAESQNMLAQNFHQIFQTQTRWCCPVLYAVNSDLRNLSLWADNALQERRSKPKYLEEAARTMNKAFSYCVTDRFSQLEKSRKWGTYHIVNLLFKTYFKLSQTNLCTNILRSIAAGDIPPLDKYPLADQVTFKYFTGILAFYNENYKLAEQELSFALVNCYRGNGKAGRKKAKKNIIMILNFLIPTRFILGILPQNALLERYPALHHLYGNFVLAIRRGDVKLYDDSLLNLQTELVNHGTYLTVERTRSLAVRMLFKRVWLANERSSRVPMSQFQRALHLSGTDESLEAVQCLLANMIDKGFLKGYLSYEREMVVLAKESAFPPVTVASI